MNETHNFYSFCPLKPSIPVHIASHFISLITLLCIDVIITDKNNFLDFRTISIQSGRALLKQKTNGNNILKQ